MDTAKVLLNSGGRLQTLRAIEEKVCAAATLATGFFEAEESGPVKDAYLTLMFALEKASEATEDAISAERERELAALSSLYRGVSA